MEMVPLNQGPDRENDDRPTDGEESTEAQVLERRPGARMPDWARGTLLFALVLSTMAFVVIVAPLMFDISKEKQERDASSKRIEDLERENQELRKGVDNPTDRPSGQSTVAAVDGAGAAAIETKRVEPRVPPRVPFPEDDVLRKDRRIECERLVSETKDELDELKEKAERWPQRISELLVGQPGKKIAAEPQLVADFISLQDKEHLSEAKLKSLEQRFDNLHGSFEDAVKDGTELPSDKWRQALEGLADEIHVALLDYRRDQKQLDTILDDTAHVEPSEVTLTEAIKAAKDRQAERDRQELTETREKARAAAFQEVLAAEAERVTEEQDLAAAEKRHQTGELQRKRQAVEDAEAEAQEQARLAKEKARLRKEALDPDMLKLLKPLTTPGYTRITGFTGTVIHTEKSTERKPISWSVLKTSGALEGDRQGISTIVGVCTAYMSDRPRWVGMNNTMTQTPAQLEMIGKVQEHLKKYGEILVEEELLAP